jgi:3-hydroxybutyryl-CoA dehydratase
MAVEVMYDDIKIGDKASFSKTITESDIDAFAELSGDNNPIHIDEEFAKNSMFKTRIAHGFLCGSLFSTVMGTILPGINSIYLSQEMNFKAPVKIGDTITAICECVEKNDKKKIMKFKTVIKNQDGTVVIDGHAMVMKYER